MKLNYLGSLFMLGVLAACSKVEPVANSTTNSLQHLTLANDLVNHISVSNTRYQHGTSTVSWNPYQSYTDCSGLLNALFRQAYQVDDAYFTQWLGTTRPLAFTYYDAIKAGNRFQRITRISDVQPGDFIAIKYVDPGQHDENTGHCLVVDAAPTGVGATALLVSGTTQYGVLTIDSSEEPHGPSDTRYTSATTYYPGLGKGTFRLYADSQGAIVGYSWSTQTPLKGFDPLQNPIVIGRQTAFGSH